LFQGGIDEEKLWMKKPLLFIILFAYSTHNCTTRLVLMGMLVPQYAIIRTSYFDCSD